MKRCHIGLGEGDSLHCIFKSESSIFVSRSRHAKTLPHGKSVNTPLKPDCFSHSCLQTPGYSEMEAQHTLIHHVCDSFTNEVLLHLENYKAVNVEREITSASKYVGAAVIMRAYSFVYVERRRRTRIADLNYTARNSPVYHLTYGSMFCVTIIHQCKFARHVD